MKASLKFRDDQKPLFRAKVPLTILGLPFQSSLTAAAGFGSSKDLCLSFSTHLDSGPALRLSYRPNDPANPISLLLKTGAGHLGSPLDAPITFTADFNLFPTSPSKSSNPRFFIHFKPQFGDFSIKKSQTSVFAYPVERSIINGKAALDDDVDDDDESIEVIERLPGVNGHYGDGKRMAMRTSVGGVVDSAMKGMDLGARTVLPIRNGAVLKFRWGVKFRDDLMGLFSSSKERLGNRRKTAAGIPMLVMNKIGIEYTVGRDRESRKEGGSAGSRFKSTAVVPGGVGEVAEAWWYGVRREMDGLQAENEQLRQAVDDLRAEFAAAKGKNEGRRPLGRSASVGLGGGSGMKVAGDGTDQLKKASV